MEGQERDIPRNYTLEYLVEDEFCVFHADEDQDIRDLDIIKIRLPRLDKWYSDILGREVSRDEALTYVAGYGKAPEDQMFERTMMPDKIKNIVSIIYEKKQTSFDKAKYKSIRDVKLQDIYEELELNEVLYEEELNWIRREIKRSYVGYWFFNCGKPTFINGANYFFLNYWKIKNEGKNDNFPDYREYQKDMFHALMYFWQTRDGFFKHRVVYREMGVVKSTGRNGSVGDITEEFNSRGVEYHIERNANYFQPMNERVFHGVNFISGRRIAKTAISCCFCTWGTLRKPDQTFIIQGMNEDQAVDKVYIKQIQRPVSKLPFFFRPHTRGDIEKKTGMSFQYDGEMIAMERAGLVSEQMECFITPLSSMERAADGEAEIAFVYRDEPAKKIDAGAKDQNIPRWWNSVMKPAISRGAKIKGFCIMPSTVGEMDTGGGAQFLELVNGSHFSDRNDSGRTDTGLVNLFLAGQFAREGFIDRYGRSIVEDPEMPVMTNEGNMVSIGAKRDILNEAESLERKGSFKELIQLKQNFPMTWRDAWAVVPKEMGMPIQKMRERLKDLKFDRSRSYTIRGNFEWSNGFGSNVRWQEDEEGDWTVSWLPPMDKRNLRIEVDREMGYVPSPNSPIIYAPDASVANKFYLCCDPIKFNRGNVKGRKISKPAASIFYKYDNMMETVNGDPKPREEWVSNDYIAYYLKQVENKDEYHEAWLKAAIFYGSYVYPEWPDAEGIVEYFRLHGFDGYLLRDMGTDGKVETRAGVWASAETINEMIGDMMSYFSNNVKYMKIWQIIEEWTQMRGADDLTNHDLCAATGWCQRAIKSRLPEVYLSMNEAIEIETEFPSYDV